MAHLAPNPYELPQNVAEVPLDSTAETSMGQPSEAGTTNAVLSTQPFQFSMATGLRVVTGICILVSFTTWQPMGGAMFASLIVGSWWSHLAVRAGRRKLAYYLAAWPMGVVVYAIFLGGLLMVFVDGPPKEAMHRAALAVIAIMMVSCLACLVTVRLLRRLIRKPNRRALSSALAVYLTSYQIVIAGILFVTIVDKPPVPFPEVLGLFFLLLFFTLIGTTMWMPLAWPISAGFCAILRCIDPEGTAPTSETAPPNRPWPSGHVPGRGPSR